MKIVLSVKFNKEEIINDLKKKGFEFGLNSFGDIWVYGIKNINYIDLTDKDGFKITIEKEKDFEQYSIYLEDLNYFEVHKEEVR